MIDLRRSLFGSWTLVLRLVSRGEEGRGEVVVIDGQIVSRYGTGYLPFVSFFMSI